MRCEFRADDWKRAPISQEYVTALEGRIAALESLLSDIKSTSGHERDTIVECIDFVDHLPAVSAGDSSAIRSRRTGNEAGDGQFWSKCFAEMCSLS